MARALRTDRHRHCGVRARHGSCRLPDQPLHRRRSGRITRTRLGADGGYVAGRRRQLPARRLRHPVVRPIRGRPGGVRRHRYHRRWPHALRHDDGAPRRRGPELAVSFPRDLWVDIPGRRQAEDQRRVQRRSAEGRRHAAVDFDVPINHYLEVELRDLRRTSWTRSARCPCTSRARPATRPTGFDPRTAPAATSSTAPTRSRSSGRGTSEYLDPNGKYDPETGQRWSVLDATADIGRIKRQQDFVRSSGGSPCQHAIDDPLLAPDIVDALLPNLHADTGFDRAAFNQLVRAFMGTSDDDRWTRASRRFRGRWATPAASSRAGEAARGRCDARPCSGARRRSRPRPPARRDGPELDDGGAGGGAPGGRAGEGAQHVGGADRGRRHRRSR